MVKPGDMVLSTDPATSKTVPREVIATLPHTDQLLTLDTSGGQVVTTEDHRYWDVTDHAWEQAQDLDPGDQLQSLYGEHVTVKGLDWATRHTAPAYDLTINQLHTYYVAAGDRPVLVHNYDWGNPSTLERLFRDHGADFGAV